jgi:transglutaminase-like putative cysteine protease
MSTPNASTSGVALPRQFWRRWWGSDVAREASQASQVVAPSERFLNARDIYWLIAAYVFVLLPHADRLPWAVSVVGALVLAWRTGIAGLGWRRAPRLALYALVIVAAVGTHQTYGRLWGRDAGVMLLICMLMLKLLEMRSSREVTLAIYLGMFLVVTNFFYSQSMLMAGYMLVCLWLFFSSMIGFNRVGAAPTLKERLRPAGLMLLAAVPLAAVFFLFFPRIQGPLWRMPDDQRAARTGLSDNMQPGLISQLIRDESTAFTVRFSGPVPPSSLLYWRGPVLWNTDGSQWTMPESWGGPQLATEPHPLKRRGGEVTYTITTALTNQPWVLALDVPSTVPQGIGISRDYQLVALPTVRVRPGEGASRANYTVTSQIGYQIDEPRGKSVLRYALEFPTGSNPRTRALGESWKTKHPDNPRERLNEALRLFEREFTYTLEPPPLAPTSPYDDFLFNTKRGFCEHYSGSFVLLMRAAGLPARVVTGYMGGELNPYNNTLIVKQSDAHAWTEVHLEGEGWVRVDPTNAVAPTRIERGIGAALGPVGVFSAFEAADPLGIVAWTRLQWSAFNYQWNQWVIGYNAEAQRSFMERLGISSADWVKLTQWLVYSASILAALAALWMLLQDQLLNRKAPLDSHYAKFCERMAKAGLPREPHEGPRTYFARIARQRPDIALAASEIIERYEAIRYAGDDNPKRLAELRALARRFAA